MTRPPRRPDDTDVLDALQAGAPIRVPVVVVVAHPDDETLAMGGRLPLIASLTIVQLTDGSPASLEDARRTGHETREAYAATREQETELALRRLGVTPRRIRYGARDQDAVDALAAITKALLPHLREAEIVFTHPYEGGHPDHDTAACAVQTACDRIGAQGGDAPLRLEFASYHSRDGMRRAGEFWADAEHPERIVRLTGDPRTVKREALACFRSQADIVDWFDPDVERYRIAPRYDFSGPPPPRTALYDSFGWAMTSADWRARARRGLAALAAEAA